MKAGYGGMVWVLGSGTSPNSRTYLVRPLAALALGASHQKKRADLQVRPSFFCSGQLRAICAWCSAFVVQHFNFAVELATLANLQLATSDLAVHHTGGLDHE